MASGIHKPEQTEADRQRVHQFKYLTEVVLPSRAAEEHWPIRLDHCFKRICLDHAFEDVWYNHLSRPAERHLTGQSLDRALACADDLSRGDLALLQARNHTSLNYRGKTGKPQDSGRLPRG